MHDCVFKLLRTKDPENLECLCRLLTTIGKELETDKAKVSIDHGKIVPIKSTWMENLPEGSGVAQPVLDKY